MQIELDRPLDMHIHLREGDMLSTVAPLSARHFAGGVVMPNLLPPVDTIDRLVRYRDAVKAAVGDNIFVPYMTLFFRSYSRAELEAARPHIIGIKLYPAGVTTNSEAGVDSVEEFRETFALMEELGIPLLVHGETDGFVMDRENEFLDTYRLLAERFPRLRVTMEHITTAAAVDLLDSCDNFFATVTMHHLLITLDDLAGGALNPHLFCKPIAKRPEDREALLSSALEAHPRLMFGSDSAPHPVSSKECCGCAAGVFTAPIALPMLAELFALHGCLENLRGFVSGNARRIYGVEPPPKTVVLEDSPSRIPDSYDDVVPMSAGREIGWSVTEIAQ